MLTPRLETQMGSLVEEQTMQRRASVRSLATLAAATLLVTSAVPALANGKRIGMASREITNDYNRGIIAGAQKVIEASGDTMAVVDGGGDPRKHNENIENLINAHVDGLIIQLGDAQQLAPEVAKAKAAGIPVVTTSVGAKTEGALTEVGGDEDLMATMMTRALLSSIGYQGDVYVVWVPGAPLLETRKRILEAMIKDYPKVKLHEVPTEHSAAKVQSQMEDLLTANPDVGSITAVWGAYDLLTSGAVQAERDQGRLDRRRSGRFPDAAVGRQPLRGYRRPGRSEDRRTRRPDGRGRHQGQEGISCLHVHRRLRGDPRQRRRGCRAPLGPGRLEADQHGPQGNHGPPATDRAGSRRPSSSALIRRRSA